MNIFFVTILTYGLYRLAKFITTKISFPLFHPLLFTPALIILTITLLNIPADDYLAGATLLTHLLGPAVIAFAVPVYKHLSILKKHVGKIVITVLIGSIVAIVSSHGLALVFQLEEHFLVSMLPRSITTPLAMEVSEDIGGVPALTIVFVIITGICGSLIAPSVFKLFAIKSQMAKGLALGMSAHAVGTNKALQYGEEATTFSTLAMVLAGVITIILGRVFIPLFL